MTIAKPHPSTEMLSEPLSGSPPHLLGQDMACVFFDIETEAILCTSLPVCPGDSFESFAYLMDRTTAVQRAEVQM